MIFKDVPERFKEEFDLFRKEVIEEVTRLEDEANDDEESVDFISTSNPDGFDSTQQVIDRLRSKVAQLSSKIEAGNK